MVLQGDVVGYSHGAIRTSFQTSKIFRGKTDEIDIAVTQHNGKLFLAPVKYNRCVQLHAVIQTSVPWEAQPRESIPRSLYW